MKKYFTIALLLGLVSLLAMPTAAQDNCPTAPAPRLQSGGQGTVAQSYSSLRQDFNSNVIIATMHTGDVFTVTGEARCNGAHYWYPVEFNGQAGWVTEGYLNSYWVEPFSANGDTQTPGTDDFGTGGPLNLDPVTGVAIFTPAQGSGCPGAPTPRIAPGETVAVAQSYSNIRPGVHSNTVLRTVVPGESMQVIAGPVCSNLGPYNWYQVQIGNTTGWTTEGTGNAYWLMPTGL